MIDNYRIERWMGLLDATLHHMTTKISENRQKYKDMDPESAVVPIQQILEEKWNIAAGTAVNAIEANRCEFKVTEVYEPKINSEVLPQTKTIHNVIFPKVKICTCGK